MCVRSRASAKAILARMPVASALSRRNWQRGCERCYSPRLLRGRSQPIPIQSRCKMEFTEKAVIMTAGDINRALARMASQIVENNPDLSGVLLVGIRRRGVPLAERIATKIQE